MEWSSLAPLLTGLTLLAVGVLVAMALFLAIGLLLDAARQPEPRAPTPPPRTVFSAQSLRRTTQWVLALARREDPGASTQPRGLPQHR